jgi:hypothetical protein
MDPYNSAKAALVERDGHRLLVADAAGPLIGSFQDIVDLMEQAWEQAPVIVLPVARLNPDFFQLRSGMAGEIVQKIATYGGRLAIVGDISTHTVESNAFRDFVREANRGRSIFFLPDMDALVAKLSALAVSGS